MTYIEAIQKKISEVDMINDHCEALRDAASEEEKDAWNNTRFHLQKVMNVLNRLDNNLPDHRAHSQLNTTY